MPLATIQRQGGLPFAIVTGVSIAMEHRIVRGFPDAAMRAAPDCRQRADLLSFSTGDLKRMQKHLDSEERLDILRRADGIRKWHSLDDKRICVICERVFTGRQIEIHRDERGRYRLECPTEGCPSFVAHWFHVGNAAHAAATVLRGGNKPDNFTRAVA